MRVRAAIVATLAVLALAGCATGKDAVDQTSGSGNGFVDAGITTKVYPAGERPAAPAYTGDLLGGGTFDLAAQRGHVVVLNLWGSWCAPCRVEARDLEAAYRAAKDRGVVFIGDNIRDDHDGATAFEKAHGITYPSVSDPGSRFALAFRDLKVPPSAIPSTIVIDASGHVAAVHLGSITQAQLTDLIARAS